MAIDVGSLALDEHASQRSLRSRKLRVSLAHFDADEPMLTLRLDLVDMSRTQTTVVQQQHAVMGGLQAFDLIHAIDFQVRQPQRQHIASRLAFGMRSRVVPQIHLICAPHLVSCLVFSCLTRREYTPCPLFSDPFSLILSDTPLCHEQILCGK